MRVSAAFPGRAFHAGLRVKSDPSRRIVAASLVAAPALALASCGFLDSSARNRPRAAAEADPLPPPDEPPAGVPAAADATTTIGTGTVRIALVLPFSGPRDGAAAAASLRNAVELAISEFASPSVTIAVRDDRGTAEGARAAATAAFAEGAELVLGPLFAPSVAAVGTVARGQDRPVIAFSTDAGVASRGVYLLSFLPGNEVERVIAYAATERRRSVAALLPDTTYGQVVEASFVEAAARRGFRVVATERYAAGQPGPAVSRLASAIAGRSASADTLFMPVPGDDLAAVSGALSGIGFDPARVRPLGTGLWSDGRAARLPVLAGGLYAGPEGAGFAAFAARYRARFGQDPVRLATLAYDAASLAAALAREPAPGRFAEATLAARTGFAGADGAFRFRSDGTSERALAIHELRPEGAVVVSAAPKTFAA